MIHIDFHNDNLCYLEFYSLQNSLQILKSFDLKKLSYKLSGIGIISIFQLRNLRFMILEIHDTQITYPKVQTP